MPWCPDCEEEYIEGVDRCPECGEDLVSVLPGESPEVRAASERRENAHVEEKLLYTAATEVDYALITDALEKEGIPFITRERGIWDYFHILSGHSFAGQEIYVADHDYAKAIEIADYFKELKDADVE